MKKRKVLTKLGIIFGIIDLILILIGVLFFKPKTILAEELQNDFFINSEIYLFNDINAINFENGYIDKELITMDDKNNNENWFGWYSNLGYKLVERNFDDTNQYYCLAIPLNNMLSKYLQFAFRFSRGPDLALIIKYSDNTTTEFATSDYTETKQIYTPIAENINKNVKYIAWEIYNPDYYISFLPLTQEGYYVLGFEEGKSTGIDEGIQIGYNIGYYDGYQNGIESGEIIYDTILNFNQLIRNGNFTDYSYWQKLSNNCDLTINDNTALVTLNTLTQTNYEFGIFTANQYQFSLNHKLFVNFNVKTNKDRYIRIDTNGTLNILGDVSILSQQNTWTKYQRLATGTGNAQILSFYPVSASDFDVGDTIEFKNIYIVDLTEMYGEGNEPTLEQCENIFGEYYNYTLSTPVEIGFFTGYYEGKNEGIYEGINIGETNQINMSWIQSIFQAMQGFFNIQIFPRVTLGIIVGIPFIISLAWFVIRMFRGGGGGED